MATDIRPKENVQISEEAADWFVEFRSDDIEPITRQAFSDWLRASPEHVRAYLEIAAIWNEGACLDAKNRYHEEELIALAREVPVVIPLAASATMRAASGSPGGRVHAPWRRFAAAASLLIAAAGLFVWHEARRGVFGTEVGEMRSLALEDGSTVQLNSRSRMKVRFSEAEREVILLDGQALFQVAKDARRPFVVWSDATEIRAVGTQFDVNRRQAGTTVTVLEGRVEVTALGAGDRSTPGGVPGASETRERGSGAVLLAAGQQVVVHRGAKPALAGANLAAATAWTHRQLIFNSATLAEVAEEFNRYNKTQIVLKDPEVVDFHISGVFSSTDPGALIRFLRQRRGIEVVETEDGILISSS